MKIAVTGSKGRLGSRLIKAGCERLRCDITKPRRIAEAIEEIAPVDCIINCSAWTDVDGAEKRKNYDEVMAVNLRGPFNLRTAFDGLLIQISTGYVFDGTSGPNSEDDQPGPLNIYGWSKWGGEKAAAVREPTLVVRTLDLFGPHENGRKHTDFVQQIRDILELGAEKELPDTLYGTPTYIPHLAEALLEAARRETTGVVVHIASDLTLSRHEWGRKIAEVFGYDPNLIIPTDEIAGAAPRPLKGGLCVDKAKSLGLPIYSPVDGLRVLQDLEQASGEVN